VVSAGYQAEVIAAAERNGADYTVTAKDYTNVPAAQCPPSPPPRTPNGTPAIDTHIRGTGAGRSQPEPQRRAGGHRANDQCQPEPGHPGVSSQTPW
jgi:hypothetical protein